MAAPLPLGYADAVQDAFPQRLQYPSFRYRAIDIARCRAHEMSGDDLPEPVDDSPDALARLAERSDAAALGVCLDRLKAERRRLVLLVFVEGLSYAQAAERMEMPIGSAKSSIRRNLQALRQNLEGADREGSVAKIGHRVHTRKTPLAGRITSIQSYVANLGDDGLRGAAYRGGRRPA